MRVLTTVADVHWIMAQFEPTLPTLRTLATLSLRDADMLLSLAERMYATHSTIEARWALRRIDTYRRLLGLPCSILGMERIAAKAVRHNEHARRSGLAAMGTARHSVVRPAAQKRLRLAG